MVKLIKITKVNQIRRRYTWQLDFTYRHMIKPREFT